MLTPTQKAQLGTGLLQEAILEVLNQQGGNATQTQILQGIGAGSNSGNSQEGSISNSVLTQMVQQNLVTQTGQGNQTRFQIVAQQKGASSSR